MSKYFKYPFAELGDNVVIPDDIQSDGSVSYRQGWGVDYQRKIGKDSLAKPVPREQTNQLYNDITGGIKYQQEHGFFDFISPEMNGGEPFAYAMAAAVRYDMSDARDGSDIRNFTSKINNNTGNPKDNPNDWIDLSNTNYHFASTEETIQGTVTDKAVNPLGLASVIATTEKKGLIQLATDEEVINGVNTTKAITPAALLNTYKNNALTENGYQILPSGLIIQWGSIYCKTDQTNEFTFPIAFSNQCFHISGCGDVNYISSSVGRQTAFSFINLTVSGAVICNDTIAQNCRWFAIGI